MLNIAEGFVSYRDLGGGERSHLSIHQCGYQPCAPGFSYGPFIRAHYLIYFIVDGTGKFVKNDVSYTLGKGKGLIIRPGETTKYFAANNASWSFIWVGFSGTDVEGMAISLGLHKESPVFETPDFDISLSFIKTLLDSASSIEANLRMIGYLYLFLSTITSSAPKSDAKLLAEKAAEYIYDNFGYNIRIADVAKYIGVDRTYLFRLFKQHYCTSPQQYLMDIRIETAKRMLSVPGTSIYKVSSFCGFGDTNYFSKIFRKKVGVPPSFYATSLGNANDMHACRE
ncbi:MAG: helix-turn-helix domain-containing protein [Bacillota bacterium]